MTRPSQVLLVLVVALLGVQVARARGAAPDPWTLVAGLVVLVAVAASIHLANEYADHETDARTRRTPFSGGSGALAATGLPRDLAIRAAIVALGFGAAGAAAGLAWGILPAAAVAVLALGAAGGWAYSVGPFPLAWRGLGEAGNALLGGLVLPLYGVTLAGGALDAAAVAAFLPLTLLVGANLLATTWPDREADAAVGKRTLATRLSPRVLRGLFAGIVALVVGGLVLQATDPGTVAAAVAGLVAMPLALAGLVAYTRIESPAPTVIAMVAFIGLQVVGWSIGG